LVLLDWRLPRVSGRQVLDFIRSEPKLRSMPVVVLSSSTDEADVTASYEGCANCWVSKPLDMDEYIRAVQSISGFWSNVARLPRG